MKNKKQSIGQRIKELREMKGWTQSQLGEYLFVSDKTVSKWEKDKSEPESNLLVKIANLFSVSLDYLLAGDEPQIEHDAVSRIELACREDNITLLDGIDFEAFDDKGKNIDFYIKKYKSKAVRDFIKQWKIEQYIKDGTKKKKYVICGIPKGLIGDDNLIALSWGGRYEDIASKCADYEKDGFHHFKIFRTIDMHENVEVNYQHFYAKTLNENGQTKMAFQVSLCDDLESGIIRFDIFRNKTFNDNKHSDGKLVPDYYPLSDTEFSCCYYVKPKTLSIFLNLLNELNIDSWENKHWGTSLYNIAYAIKPKNDKEKSLRLKYYVDPGRDLYKRFIAGIQQLFLDSLSQTAYRKFINEFDSKYNPYYREEISLCESTYLFKNIEREELKMKEGEHEETNEE